MYKRIIILFLSASLISCKDEKINFDKAELSTLIRVQIDTLFRKNSTTIHIESTLIGGTGQIIYNVGHCWNKNYMLLSKDTNSIFIPYLSISQGYRDRNGDGQVDLTDFEYPIVHRKFSSDMHVEMTSGDIIYIMPFVTFNDSLVIYGRNGTLYVEW
jgi:hypothetical protein